MQNSKQMKNNGLSKSSILLIIITIILVIIVAMMFLSNKKDTETTKSETKQVSTNTSVKKENNSSNQNTQPEATQNPEEFVETKEDGTKVNTSEKVKQTKKISNFEVTDINLTTSNGISTMIAKVKNTGSAKSEEKKVTIQILDKDGNVITDFLGVINPIEPGATTTLNASVTADVSNAYDFKLIEK